jgi:hypothetical protein
VRKAPAIIKPPPNNTRLPANMENPRPNNNRPRIGGAPLWSAMAPPSTPNSHKVQGRVGENPVKKKPAQWVFLFFLVFLVFLVFFIFLYIFAQKREFLGFFQFQEYLRVHPDFKLESLLLINLFLLINASALD